jgi:thioredoxin-dependent peroxiredoxin
MLKWLFEDPLPVGSPAPDFVAFDQERNRTELTALRGRPVILVFYPGDDTPTCTKQLCELRDNWATLEAKGVAVFGVNPQGMRSHSRFRTKHNLPFPLLVDKRGQLARLYHAGGLLVRRTVYGIGADGIIRFVQRGVPSPSEILAALSL